MSEAPPPSAGTSEVRISDYARRVLRRWYVVVIAIIVAIAVVFLHGVSAAHGQSEASAIVYIGQPTTPNGSAVFPNPPFSNPSAITATINSQAALQGASRASGVPVSKIHGNVAAHVISAGGGSSSSSAVTKTTTGATYYSIVAQGPWGARKAAAIANSLAASVRNGASTYSAIKIHQLRIAIATERASITTLRSANASAQRAADALAGKAGSNPSDAAVMSSLLTQISANTATIANTENQLSEDTISLASATGIEAPQITTVAVGHGVTATNRRSSLVVAAGVGLIVGVALALAVDALRRRRPAEAPA
ncbi:MAG TPA: hypothetical protein VFQ71_12675 [Gaiellales bacterium]|jgi:hypothetical protein|nr:hypothetical protein [Gaiellales bacterium]